MVPPPRLTTEKLSDVETQNRVLLKNGNEGRGGGSKGSGTLRADSATTVSRDDQNSYSYVDGGKKEGKRGRRTDYR